MKRVATTVPTFKSGGQVDDGVPVLHKFTEEVAQADSLSSNPTPEWTYKCEGGNQVI